jgi:hypothetical protein
MSSTQEGLLATQLLGLPFRCREPHISGLTLIQVFSGSSAPLTWAEPWPLGNGGPGTNPLLTALGPVKHGSFLLSIPLSWVVQGKSKCPLMTHPFVNVFDTELLFFISALRNTPVTKVQNHWGETIKCFTAATILKIYLVSFLLLFFLLTVPFPS